MTNAVHRIVSPWLDADNTDHLLRLRDQIIWLQMELFDDYEPNYYESFDDRLEKWLNNVTSDEDKQSLFELIEHLFFVGRPQFESLCRASYNGSVTRWLIDTLSLDIKVPNVLEFIEAGTKKTWFCPITDSMRINAYLKLNGQSGHKHRPDWRTLETFGDRAKVQRFVTDEGIERLVLLEDFVGSGTQMKSSVKWAAETLDIPILLIPLVCCPKGIETGEALSNRYSKLSFAPTLSLRTEAFLPPSARHNEPSVFTKIRDIIDRVKHRFPEWHSAPYGYLSTGALVALFSNCPDNTVALIHEKGPSWEPLFSRITRNE